MKEKERKKGEATPSKILDNLFRQVLRKRKTWEQIILQTSASDEESHLPHHACSSQWVKYHKELR